MNISQLHTRDFRYSVPSVHPRLAVIIASSDQRSGLADAGRDAAAVVLERSDTDAALRADFDLRQAAHAVAVGGQRAKLSAATAELEEVATRGRAAERRRTASSEELSAFDHLSTEATNADANRDAAWTRRRSALRHLVDAVDQLEGVEVQRRDAAATLKEAHLRDERRSGRSTGATASNAAAAIDDAARQLQDRIAAVHGALDKAETGRQVDVAVAQEELLEVLVRVTAADNTMSDVWDRLVLAVDAELLSRWGHGHPEPGMLAEHRGVLLAAELETERDRARAAVVVTAATGRRDEEARRLDELDSAGAEQARVLDAIAAWLALVAAAHATSGTAPAPIILDDTLGGVDPAARAGLMQTLVDVSGRTQVLYLTDQVDVLAWAISLPHDIGGINHVVTADHPVLALAE